VPSSLDTVITDRWVQQMMIFRRALLRIAGSTNDKHIEEIIFKALEEAKDVK